MVVLGRHLVIEAWGVSTAVLDSEERIKESIKKAVVEGGATLIDICVHKFSPHGVTATATLAESHIAIHTWPEYGYAAIDIFFCGRANPEKAMKILLQELGASEMKVHTIDRGFTPAYKMIS